MTRLCSMCGTEDRVLHFRLARQVKGIARWTTRGAGPIDLCEACWSNATSKAARRRRPVAGAIVGIALLVLGCSSPAQTMHTPATPTPATVRPSAETLPGPSDQPSPELPRYVAGGQAGGDVQWLVTVPCSHKPTGWQDARSACDWDAIAAVIVTPEVYAAKNQGDPWP